MSRYGSVNPELLGLARQRLAAFIKQAMIPGGPDAMMGGGGMPPGGGGMPPGGGGMPMDPGMGGGMPMDPGMGGGMPMDPGMGGEPPPPMGQELQPMIQQAVQAALASQGGGGGAGGAGIKPKIDVNVVLLQILKILAKISDALGIHVPTQDMVVTPDDLQAMAAEGPGAAVAQAQNPEQGPGAMGPIEPMPGVKTGEDSYGLPDFRQTVDRATAVLKLRRTS